MAAPATGYKVDETTTVTGSGGVQTQTSANSETKSWYNYDQTTNVVTSKGECYVVKTADGKYAKIKITDYYSPDSAKKSGYYTFQYMYHSDGSTNFH